MLVMIHVNKNDFKVLTVS